MFGGPCGRRGELASDEVIGRRRSGEWRGELASVEVISPRGGPRVCRGLASAAATGERGNLSPFSLVLFSRDAALIRECAVREPVGSPLFLVLLSRDAALNRECAGREPAAPRLAKTTRLPKPWRPADQWCCAAGTLPWSEY